MVEISHCISVVMIYLNRCASFQLLALDKLTSEQKAELMFQLEASAKLNLNAITQIFQSLLHPLVNVTLNMTSVSSNGLDQVRYEFCVLDDDDDDDDVAGLVLSNQPSD